MKVQELTTEKKRHTRGSPCPICGGADGDRRGTGTRCHGWTEGDYSHCSRVEVSGAAQENGGTWPHFLAGRCGCGTDHRSYVPAHMDSPSRGSRVVREKSWQILDSNARHVCDHVRRDFENGEKTYSWRVPGHDREGLHGLKKASLPLYGAELLCGVPADRPVVVCEGEKAADALRGLIGESGVAVGTVTGAAGSPNEDALRMLIGRPTYLWPDNDDEGRKHVDLIATSLVELGSQPFVIAWAGAREKGDDAADFVGRGGTTEDLRLLLADAKPWRTQAVNESATASGGRKPSLEAEIAKLAALPVMEYELSRKAEAKRLGVRTDALDREVQKARGGAGQDGLQGERLELSNPEPWPEPVIGAEVLDETAAGIRRYVALPPHAAEGVALWIAHAHVLAIAREAFDISPRLAFTSPTPRCGKTTALMLVELLSPRALNAANVTPAAIFRTIDLARPTLIVDEADALFAEEAEELRGLLNAGHRDGCGVVRVVGEDHEPRSFDVFGPVALAAIGRLPGTLEDRALLVIMRRRLPGEQVEKCRRRKLAHLEEVKRRLFRWAAENVAALTALEPQIPEALDDRAADNWTPLLAIAEAAGGNWPERGRKAALALSASREDGESVKVRLLADIRAILESDGNDRIPSAALVERLAAIEEAPWSEWGKREKPISSVQLARLLAGFGVRPKGIRLPDGSTPKGYTLEDFTDAFGRYLPTSDPQHRNNGSKTNRNDQEDEFPEVQQRESVADRDSSPRSGYRGPKADCGGVADQKPGNGAAVRCAPCGRPGHTTWRSQQGVTMCGTCHPPASEALVAEWINEEATP